jgi:hypothetical protein
MIGSSEVLPADWIAAYPPPRSLPLDQEALRIYERAYYIGIQTEKEGDPPVSFTTAMAALLVGEDDTSRWFAQQAERFGPNSRKVFDEKNIKPEIQQRAAQQTGQPSSVHLSSDKHLLTSSARAVLQNAEDWAQRVGGSDIGVRHLVASYVLNPPPYHRSQMQEWGFKESGWRPVFFDWVAQRFTWEAWTDVSQRPAPTRGLPAFDQVQAKGSSLAWPGDTSAMRILEQAARDHARRDDRWLRLQTVLYALVETAKEDETVRAAVKPLWDAIQAVEGNYRQTLSKYYLRPSSDGEHQVPFSELDISPRVLNVLETARELAAASLVHRSRDPEGEVKAGPLHLAGALLSRRVDGEEELAALGLNSQTLRVNLVLHAKKQAESEEVWREMLGEEETLLVGRPVDLNSDEPEAVVRLDENWQFDPLAIRPDVEAFAALLASTNLQPPLSIGLFGPWGSGKTTFLKRLRQAVDRRTTEEKQSGGSLRSAYVSNVVHVEFNAWHYAEDALVSSLINTIFRALSAFIKDEQLVAGKKWSEQKLSALESTKRNVEAAEARKRSALAAVAGRELDLAKERKKAAESTTKLQTVVGAAWEVAKNELRKSNVVKNSGVLEAFGDTVKSADELRARLESIRNRPGRMLNDLGWLRTILFAGLVLVLPPVMGWLVGKTLRMGQFGQLLSSVTALLSVVGLWARAATGAMTKVDNAVAKVAEAYNEKVLSATKVKEAQEQLNAARATADTVAAGLEAARSELGRAQIEVTNAALPAQMLRLVTNRGEDMSYKKELTTFSLARADLETLSAILRDQRGEATSSTGIARAVDRVILYIDDLDRCKPEDVVRVLQMTHMLLAFELFVVVVAVDARWVEEALTRGYPWLEKRDEHTARQGTHSLDAPVEHGTMGVSPQDYLEKIFQIAFWLEPMTASRAASYLASLVRSPLRDAGNYTNTEPAVAQTDGEPTPSSGKIEITALELDYMRALAAYVGPSPRRVKRLVNAYRLIKARMSDAQLGTFLTDRASQVGGLRSGPYQIVICLLVIGTGAQSETSEIIKELAEWDPKATFDDVIKRFEGRNHPDWKMAARVIETLMRTQKSKDVSELRGWARKVGRFLLHGPSEELHLTNVSPMRLPQQPKNEL